MKNIPNIISIFRILLIPVFVILFFDKNTDILWPMGIFILSGASDVLDGYLARKNGWITDVGKLLDPLADKMTQICVLICLFIKDMVPPFVLGIFIAKELFMIVGATFIFRNKKVVVQSDWTGKLATIIFYISMVSLIIIYNLPLNDFTEIAIPAIDIIAVSSTIIAFVNYYLKYMYSAKQVDIESK
ncbi:MAG: CDP-diacylglycerol--glycerol-3-phosphate 3-phosphatidyltransferase [Clostridia bacterium]|nr:CDP-diacylglycerol--glycerol-3-phosphate 3-phosphatidyltransferase [Clostridia bacterium]